MLALVVRQCLREPYDVFFAAADLQSYTASEYNMELIDEGEEYYRIENEETIDEVKTLSTEVFALRPGAYTVTVKYDSDTSADSLDSYANSTGTLSLSSIHHGMSVTFNDLKLRDAYTEESQSVQVNSLRTLMDLNMSVSFSGGGTLKIYSIQITEIVVYKYLLLAIMFVIFLLLDFIVLKFMNGAFGLSEGVLCLICLVAVLPFLTDFSYYGDDLYYHMNRIVCLSDEIKMGNYFPAIFSTALNGYGYANPLFYGQLFLYIPAILYTCGFSLTASYNAYIMLFSVATCLIMYYSALRIFKRKRCAVTAAALYTLSAVRLTNIFSRSAVGEFSAQTFLPLIVLGFYNVYTAKDGEKITLKRYAPIIIGLSGVLLTHTLSIMMSAILIVGFCIFAWKKTFQPKRFLALLKAAVLTLLVNLSFLVPFIDSYSMDLNVGNYKYYIQSSGVYLIQLFNVIVDGSQRGSVNKTASNEMSLSIGFSITLGLLLYVFFLACRDKKTVDKNEKTFQLSKACFAFTCITLFLATIYMPYDELDFLPEIIYSFITTIQFTWRWLIFATLFGTYVTVYAMFHIENSSLKKYQGISVLSCFSIIAALTLNTGQLYADQLQRNGIVRLSNNSYEYNMNVGTLYFIRSEDSNVSKTSNYYHAALLYDESAIEVSDYSRDGTTAEFYVINDSDSAQSVVLPMICYDNYVAYDANNTMLEITKGTNSRISVEVPAGYEGTIKVVYRFPYRWIAAITISIAVLIYIAIYCVYLRRKGVPLKNER